MELLIENLRQLYSLIRVCLFFIIIILEFIILELLLFRLISDLLFTIIYDFRVIRLELLHFFILVCPQTV